MEDCLSFTGTRCAGAESSTIVVVRAPLALLCAQPGEAASFDCAKAATDVKGFIRDAANQEAPGHRCARRACQREEYRPDAGDTGIA